MKKVTRTPYGVAVEWVGVGVGGWVCRWMAENSNSNLNAKEKFLTKK